MCKYTGLGPTHSKIILIKVGLYKHFLSVFVICYFTVKVPLLVLRLCDILIFVLQVEVIPDSVKFVESAIDKLHGSLIPVETLVQTNRNCVVNISSLQSFAKNATASCTSKDSTSLMGLVSYTSVIAYHLQQTKSGTLANDSLQIQCNLLSNSKLCGTSYMYV